MSIVQRIFSVLRRNLYRFKGENYSFLEAIFWPHVDIWLRYASLASELEGKNLSILDAGSGGDIISAFLNPLEYKITVLDVRKEVLSNLSTKSRVDPVIGDGCHLPFRSSSFDVTISVGSIEHVPRTLRRQFLSELKRTAKMKVIVYTPAISNDKFFRGQEYDIKFSKAHRRLFGIEDKRVIEHIESGGAPSISELVEYLPNAKINELQNCDVWLTYMLLSLRPDPFMYLTGMIYWLFLKKRDHTAPYYGCKVIWNKSARANPNT